MAVSEPLNADAYAFICLQREYRHQMDEHARLRSHLAQIRADAERIEAKALTASDRATSIMETLLKLEPPRGEQSDRSELLNQVQR